MSYLKSIEKMVNETMKQFSINLATKHNLNSDEIYSLWLSMNSSQQNPIVVSSEQVSPCQTPVSVSSKSVSKELPSAENVTIEKITNIKTTVDMLKAFCKSKGLSQSGKKDDLVKRLLETFDKGSSPAVSSGSEPKTKKPAKSVEPEVIKHLREKTEKQLEIKVNSFKNFEHTETHFVFNKNKQVFGKQNSDGTVASLTKEDIETCKRYKFLWVAVDNLNASKNLDELNIEELDEESNEIEDEPEEILEEDDLEDEVLEDEN